MKRSIFITGTDTGVGKTVITGLFLKYLLDKGVNAVTQKWVQTGCYGSSEDIETHYRIAGEGAVSAGSKQDMAPYILKFPASPHFAALRENTVIDPAKIKDAYAHLKNQFDIVIVEGVGGPLVPINEDTTIADITADIKLDTVIVAENRLGAINQTLSAVEVLEKRGINIAGIIFNRTSKGGNDDILKDNIDIVQKFTGKVLGEIPFSKNSDVLYNAFLSIGEKIFL